jgi:hypothetical protein
LIEWRERRPKQGARAKTLSDAGSQTAGALGKSVWGDHIRGRTAMFSKQMMIGAVATAFLAAATITDASARGAGGGSHGGGGGFHGSFHTGFYHGVVGRGFVTHGVAGREFAGRRIVGREFVGRGFVGDRFVGRGYGGYGGWGSAADLGVGLAAAELGASLGEGYPDYTYGGAPGYAYGGSPGYAYGGSPGYAYTGNPGYAYGGGYGASPVYGYAPGYVIYVPRRGCGCGGW